MSFTLAPRAFSQRPISSCVRCFPCSSFLISSFIHLSWASFCLAITGYSLRAVTSSTVIPRIPGKYVVTLLRSTPNGSNAACVNSLPAPRTPLSPSIFIITLSVALEKWPSHLNISISRPTICIPDILKAELNAFFHMLTNPADGSCGFIGMQALNNTRSFNATDVLVNMPAPLVLAFDNFISSTKDIMTASI